MATRLRVGVVAGIITLLSASPSAAQQPPDIVACWVEERVNEWTAEVVQVTRCRLAGGEIVDYKDRTDIPVVLNPNLGDDAVGPCWFLTSRATPYVVVNQFANGDALIGYVPDPNEPGNWIAVEIYRRCTSEPREVTSHEVRVWDYVLSYVHAPPTPEMSPRVGDGVTGLATYLGTAVPPFHEASLTGGTVTLDVEIEVRSVLVDWDDGTVVHYPPDSRALSGYPTGATWHVYQTKSDDTSISVSYRWYVRWRAGGGPWQDLIVPDTTTTVDYPITEIVSVLGR